MPKPVFAQDLVITYESEPLFDEDDIKPCDLITKTTTVTNNSTTDTYLFGIAAFDELDPDGLGGILEIRIYDDAGNDLYGGEADPKVLSELYDETEFSDDPVTPGTEIYLLTIGPGETYVISLVIEFPCEAGNVWQGTSTEFSFGMGWTGTVLGEEKEPTSVIEKVGEVLGETGQSILIGSLMGIGLLLFAKRILKKEN